MANVNTSMLAPAPVSNALRPSGNPRSVPVTLDFSSAASWTLDLDQLFSRKVIDSVQCLFIDNSGNSSPVTISVDRTGQSLIVPATSQAYLPVLVPSPARLTFACAGNVAVYAELLNVPMPAAVWATAAAVSGTTQVQDVALEAAVSGGMFQCAVIGSNGGAAVALGADSKGNLMVQPRQTFTLTSRSFVTAAAPASTQLMAANASRRYMVVKAPETADLWVNPLGGVCSVGGADCLKIPAGTMWEPAVVSGTAITYYCATGSLQTAAFEG